MSALGLSLLMLSLQLTNLGALHIQRIHSNLGSFVPDYKGRTEEELEAFLELMKTEGIVEQAANRHWKLV